MIQEIDEDLPSHFIQQYYIRKSFDESLQLRMLSDRIEEGCQSERLNSPGLHVNSTMPKNSKYEIQNISQQDYSIQEGHSKINFFNKCLDLSQKRKSSFFQEHQASVIKQAAMQYSQQENSTNNEQNYSPFKQNHNIIDLSSMKYKAISSRSKNKNKTREVKSIQVSKDLKFIAKIYHRMVNFYHRNTLSGRLYLLQNPRIRQSINDIADVNSIAKNQSFDKFISELQYCFIHFFKKIMRKVPRFNPQHTLCIISSIVFNLINCCFFVLQSVHLIFQANPPYEQTLNSIIQIIWVIQILIKLNSSTYVKTQYVKSREVILLLYFKNNALFDFLPFLIIFCPPQDHKIIMFLKVLQFVKIKNIIAEVKDIQKQLLMVIQDYYFYIQLINLILKLFLIGHFIACLWYIVYLVEREYLEVENLWFNKGVGSDGIWWKQYLNSFYWALTLMSTGSNDAQTELQMFFTSITLLFTTMTFGYFLSVIGIILSEMDEEEENWRRDFNIINKYMRKRNICKQFFLLNILIQLFHNFLKRNLQREINLDLEYYYEKNYKRDEVLNNQVLQRISCHLTQQMKQEYYGKIISNMEYIYKSFSKETIEKLALCVEECNYQPNQIIYHENDISDFSLMYLVEGKVQLTRNISKDQNQQMILAQISKNQIFGQFSFFTGNLRGKSAFSLTFSTILKIPREKFIEIIKDNEKDFQQFCYMKDNIMMYQNFESINIKCDVCHKYTHFTSDCPLVHIDKEQAYSKLRIKQNRRIFKFDSALQIQRYLQECAQQFCHNHDIQGFKKQINQAKQANLTNPSNCTDDNQENLSSDGGSDYYDSKSQIDEEEQLKQLQLHEISTLKPKKVHDKLKQLYQQNSQQIEKAQSLINDDSQTHTTKKEKPSTSVNFFRKIALNLFNLLINIKESIQYLTNENIILNQQLTNPAYFLSQSSMRNSNNQPSTNKKDVISLLLKDLQQIIANEEKNQEQGYLIQKLSQQSQINEAFNIWEMEGCKDYEIYFPEGNSNIMISMYNKRLKKIFSKNKQIMMKKSKE